MDSPKSVQANWDKQEHPTDDDYDNDHDESDNSADPDEPETLAEFIKEVSLWIWLVTGLGGLLVLIAMSSMFIRAIRRLTKG